MKGNAIFRRGAFYWLWHVYSHLLVAMTAGVILLSATHRDFLSATYPGLMRKASAVISHPHFKSAYIGTASCRERMCKYVSLLVVAVSCKQKNTKCNT